MKIGFVGLGNMGGPMAANLAKAGHSLKGYDTTDVQVDGVEICNSVKDASTQVSVVVTMLPHGQALRTVAAEITQGAAPGTILLDCSTVDIEDARFVAQKVANQGLSFVDAPVSGGVAGAAEGTLTFMVGGATSDTDAVENLLLAMGTKIVLCGGPGAGQAAKICNNMVLGISMLAVSEAFVLAQKLGLDWENLFQVVSTSSGSCWSINTYCPAPGVGPTSPADNDYKPGFAAELMLKDLLLAQSAADASGASTPLGTHAAALFESFTNDGGQGQDFSAIMPYLLQQTRPS